MPVFTVRGRGQFPADMLRHNRCWPDTSSDAALMMDARIPARTLTLRSDLTSFPTVARWESFGWQVLTFNGKDKW